MKKHSATDEVIENLIIATLGETASLRQQHLYRENLRSLVRLAKSEQIAEIKSNVRRVTGLLEAHSARRRAKAVILAQRTPGLRDHLQQQFEFKQ